MDLVSRPLYEPCPHLRVLVRCIVIDNQVNIQIRRYAFVQPAQESEKLLVTMPGPALCKDRSRGDVQCGEQSRRPIANVVMRHAFGIAHAHR